jgi:hypothetical protein
MRDCRQPENRDWYFTQLYKLNLTHRIMPGLVYLYMPELARHFGWNAEQRLWYAFLNGMTQNPITSLRMFAQLPEPPPPGAPLGRFTEWFNTQWDSLQFDTDRRYQKRDTLRSLQVYADLVGSFGSQETMLTGKPYADLWKLVTTRYYSFGRLSAFSYLEYVYLNGFGADCSDLKFEDKAGSKSHRNGMLFLLGKDQYVWDARSTNGFQGNYSDLPVVAVQLQKTAEAWLRRFRSAYPDVPNVSQFTLESNLCTFKNHFFGHRYPGIYADMAWDRIVWAEAHGQKQYTQLFRELRLAHLPRWLLAEYEPQPLSVKQKAAFFPETGRPYRAQYFL